MRLIILITFFIALSGCAKGPDNQEEVAVQGLFDAKFSADGSHALIASQLHGASLWSMSPLQRKFSWNHEAGDFTQITHVALSNDGSTAVTARNNEWIIWDAQSGQSRGFWQTPSRILGLALNTDGSAAIVGLESGDVWYIDSVTGNNIAEFQHEAPVRAVSISPDERLILSGSDDNSATFWSLDTQEPVHTIELENMSRHVAFSPSGKLAFISSLRKDHLIIDTEDFSRISAVNERYTVYNGAHFSSDEKRIFLANQQGYIQVFDTSSGDEVQRFKASPKNLFGSPRSVLSLWSDSSNLYALSSDGQLQSFSVAP